MSTHNVFSSRNKKNVGQVEFDHLHVRGQVIKFDYSTSLLIHVHCLVCFTIC